MDASSVLRAARRQRGWSLRELAARAGTSHSTLAAYEAGRVVPSVETLDRIVRAAGFALGVQLESRIGDHAAADRGRELEQVLELASMFPARHSAQLLAPVFRAR